MEYGLVLRWWVAFVALGMAGLPLTRRLLPDAPDRGAGLAVVASLTLVTTVVYLVGHLSFGLVSLLAGFAVLLGVVLVLTREDTTDDAWLDLPVPRAAGGTLLVFSAAFALFVAVRAVDPSILPVGGEKFLDFGLLKTLSRTTALPPRDMWFAGEPVQYYYGGHLMATILFQLTGTAVRYGYNLALAGFYATLVAAAYSLGGAIAHGRGADHRLGGGLAAFFVGVASNLVTPFHLLLWILPGGLANTIAGSELKSAANGPGEFYYWTASRVIDGTINEFPFFAWLNGDLHAHMVVTPFSLLSAAICYAYWRTDPVDRRRRRLLLFGALPPLGGLIALTNTWSFPSVGGLVFLTLALADADPQTLAPGRLRERLDGLAQRSGAAAELVRLGVALGAAGVVVLLAVVWYLPFFTGTASGRAVAFWPERSGLWQFLLVHGAFLLVFAASVVAAVRDTDFLAGHRWAALAAVLAWAAIAVLYGAVALGLLVPIGGLLWILRRREDQPGYEAVLIVGGMGLAIIVEYAFIQEQAGPGRLNTVFKTYSQVWLYWAVAAGVALAALINRAGRPGIGTDRLLALVSPRTRRRTAQVAVAVMLVSLSMYSGFALAKQFDDAPDPTLDATTIVERCHPNEADAINWLDAREGQPHIVTAPSTWRYMYQWTPPVRCPGRGRATYSGGNAPSVFTGLPTVAGWAHEVGYRGSETYFARVDDVETIYTGSTAERTRLLDRYDVEYIYVGPAERERYGDVSFEDTPGVGEPMLFGDVVIYPVDQAAYE